MDNGLLIFDWFVLSMRMQVFLDSLLARPGSASIWGGKKKECSGPGLKLLGQIFNLVIVGALKVARYSFFDRARTGFEIARWHKL